MGWNDHVTFEETECLDCGEIDIWEYWDSTAKVRYGGANKELGHKLGHDDSKSDRCPHCGSTRGKFVEEDDESGEYGWSD
jgi:hypothetical protein